MGRTGGRGGLRRVCAYLSTLSLNQLSVIISELYGHVFYTHHVVQSKFSSHSVHVFEWFRTLIKRDIIYVGYHVRFSCFAQKGMKLFPSVQKSTRAPNVPTSVPYIRGRGGIWDAFYRLRSFFLSISQLGSFERYKSLKV